MMKKLLLSAVLLAGTFLTSAQTVQVLSYPTEFALVSGTTYGPSVGQDACVFQVNNIPYADIDAGTEGYQGLALYSPIMPKTTLDARTPINATGKTGGGNGTGSIGTCVGLHNAVFFNEDGTQVANSRVLNYVDNGDGTASFTIVATRFNISSTPDEVTEYAPNFRYFSPSAINFSPVKETAPSSGTYEIAGMVFNSGATAETEANLLSGATTLSFKSTQKDISGSLYPNPVDNVLTVNVEGAETYRLVNTVGQTVLEQAATGSIDVSGLTAGLYILVTEKGTAKVVVE